MEKTLEELRAAITQDQEDALGQEEAGTQESVESKSDASQEGTSIEASEDKPPEGTSEDQWLVPGRFKTKDDVLKAYQELESFAGRQSSEIQKLRTAIVEPPRRGESTDEKTARLKRFADELTQDPMEAIKGLFREEVRAVKGDVKASEFKRAYEVRKQDKEFAELEPIMTEIATQYSDMIVQNGMQNDPRLLDILHLAAKGLKSSELAKKAEAEGVRKGEEASRRKGKARIETPSGTSKGKKLDITKLSAKEMKAALEKGDIDVSE